MRRLVLDPMLHSRTPPQVARVSLVQLQQQYAKVPQTRKAMQRRSPLCQLFKAAVLKLRRVLHMRPLPKGLWRPTAPQQRKSMHQLPPGPMSLNPGPRGPMSLNLGLPKAFRHPSLFQPLKALQWPKLCQQANRICQPSTAPTSLSRESRAPTSRSRTLLQQRDQRQSPRWPRQLHTHRRLLLPTLHRQWS